jgi:hypothetical protein
METPPTIYSSLTTWLQHREQLWDKFDSAKTPSEQRLILRQLRDDTNQFNEETRRLAQ